MKADTVLVNGNIVTLDTEKTVYNALAIKGSKIQALGTDEEIDLCIGADTLVLDLEGRTVTPSFVDSHNHTCEYGFSELILDLRYPDVQSITDIVEKVRKATESKPRGTWIRGVGWDDALLEEKRPPTRQDLDPVSPNHPVILDAQTPVQVANTYALDLVDTEYSESFDGLLKDTDLSYNIRLLARDYTVEECKQAILKAQEALFRVGVTAQKEAGATDTMIQAYRELHEEERLKIRSYLMVGIHNGRTTVELAKQAVDKYEPGGDDMLYLGAVKCSFDGSGGNRTAWLYEPWNSNYTGTDGYNTGGPIVPEPHTYPMIAKIIHRAGFQIGAHCVGDQTIDRYLDALEAAIIEYPRRNCRHSVIHNNLPTDYALRKETALGDNIVVEATSAYLYFIGDNYAGSFGPHRSRQLIPLQTMMERGIVVGNGCDWNTCLLNPLYGVYAAVTRKPRKGVYGSQPFGVDEQVSPYDAFRSYTWNSAYCMFWEDNIGSLEQGKYADLLVWDVNPLEAETEHLLNLSPEATMVNGDWVYKK
ncbi:amidohydrolase family protein [Candidatus Bathyarchaeota archaeon]|nr:amidohydrolase family protein [Candidatus Bathyarchaeota archaeon]